MALNRISLGNGAVFYCSDEGLKAFNKAIEEEISRQLKEDKEKKKFFMDRLVVYNYYYDVIMLKLEQLIKKEIDENHTKGISTDRREVL